jgi:hypothetical protein
MMKPIMKYALCAIVLAAFVTPALAVGKFYVVSDITSKECSVLEQKPTVASMKQVGSVHKTKAKAEKAMKVAKNCATK